MLAKLRQLLSYEFTVAELIGLTIILATPYLLMRHLRVRLPKRRSVSEVSAPIATVVAARAAR